MGIHTFFALRNSRIFDTNMVEPGNEGMNNELKRKSYEDLQIELQVRLEEIEELKKNSVTTDSYYTTDHEDKKLSAGMKSLLAAYTTHHLYPKIKFLNNETLKHSRLIMTNVFNKLGLTEANQQKDYEKDIRRELKTKINQLRAYSIKQMKKKYLGKFILSSASLNEINI